MSWSTGFPQEKWGDDPGLMLRFLREVYTRTKFGSVTWNPPSVGANTTVDTTLSTSDSDDLTGMRVGMSVSVSPPSALDTGLGCTAYVATDNTLTVRLVNATASPINPASGTWAFHGMVL